MAARKKIDWEAVEIEYRAGLLTLRDIGSLYNVSEGAIRKRAKRDEWERDISAKIQQKVRNELVRKEVRKKYAVEEKDVIEHAAAQSIAIIKGHRKQISKAQELVGTLTDQLVSAVLDREEIEDEIIRETTEDQSNLRRNAMMKAVSLPIHAQTLSNLANTMKNLVALERQSFNIADGDVDSDEVFAPRVIRIVPYEPESDS